jgi:hypothetical protein
MKHFWACTCIVLGVWAGWAHAADVDWKLYGSSKDDDGATACFYDSIGAAKAADGHVRVWAKCLSQNEMDNINIKEDYGGKILDNTARKMIGHYIPPLAAVDDIDFEKAMTVTQYEQTANISALEPHARIFYELNCEERMIRELSVFFQYSGKTGSSDTPRKWQYVAPETNGARLLKLLCR